MKEITSIKNGYVVNPGEGWEGYADLTISDGIVTSIHRYDEKPDDKVTFDEGAFDAKGCFVFPGLIDVHSHFRDPGFTEKEDIETGAKAAAAGGYTDVVLMCNTKPVVDSIETLNYVLEKGKKTAIHVHSCANVSMGMKGKELTDMEALMNAGAVGFTDDGLPLMDAEFLREAMKKSAALNLPISLHEEDKTLIAQNGINRGKASAYYKVDGSPKEAEVSLIRRDLQIASETGAILDVHHVSSGESVELIREAVLAQGTNRRIHAEVTPHHFSLTEDAIIEFGANAKCNPPLRTEEDRKKLIEGIRDNTIDLIATDHAPHTKAEKERPITEAPSGMTGLETALPLCYEELVVKENIPLTDVVAKLTYNPASVYGLDGGVIKEGKTADLCIFDPRKEWVVKEFASKASNSPFLGRALKGMVIATVCDGKLVYQREE